MVIQCTQCQTRFKLADEKLKPGGIKVRCAKCKQIFAVLPPEPVVEPPLPEEKTAPEEDVDFGAFNMEPASAEAGIEKGAAADLGGAAPDFGAKEAEFSFEEEVEAKGAEETEASFGEEAAEEGAAVSFEEEAEAPGAEEPEFTFGEEAAEEGAGEFSFEEEAGAPEFTFGEKAAEEGTAVSFEEEVEATGAEEREFSFGEEAAEEGAGEFSFEEEAGAPEFTFGEEGAAFSFEEETEAPGVEEPEASFAEEAEEEGFGEFSFEEDALASKEEAPAFTFGEEETPEGPGEFSFDENAIGFEIEKEPALAEAPAEPSDEFDFSEMTFGEEPPPTEPTPEEALDSTSVGLDQGAAPAAETPAPKAAKEGAVQVPASPRRKSPLSGLMIFTIALMLSLSGAAGYFFWQGGTLDIDRIIARISGQSAVVAPAGQIRLTGLSGVFVTNREAGQMFMISGQAVNEYPEARSAIAVKGVLHDAAGKKVMQQTAFCGNPLDESTLRSFPFAKIEERMNNQFGDSLSNLNVAAGKTIPFTIVFRNLPDELAEFTVEVADSKPGSKQ